MIVNSNQSCLTECTIFYFEKVYIEKCHSLLVTFLKISIFFLCSITEVEVSNKNESQSHVNVRDQ